MAEAKHRGASVNLPPWDGTPREAAECWTLRKGKRVASCHFRTHPKGGEARLTVDGEWHRGEAVANGTDLLDLALEWRAQFEAKRLEVDGEDSRGKRCYGTSGARSTADDPGIT